MRLSERTREYFGKAALTQSGALRYDLLRLGRSAVDRPDAPAMQRVAAASSFYNTLLRTTCVATQVSAGFAESAVPERAEATVNCRILPEQSVAAAAAESSSIAW